MLQYVEVVAAHGIIGLPERRHCLRSSVLSVCGAVCCNMMQQSAEIVAEVCCCVL